MFELAINSNVWQNKHSTLLVEPKSKQQADMSPFERQLSDEQSTKSDDLTANDELKQQHIYLNSTTLTCKENRLPIDLTNNSTINSGLQENSASETKVRLNFELINDTLNRAKKLRINVLEAFINTKRQSNVDDSVNSKTYTNYSNDQDNEQRTCSRDLRNHLSINNLSLSSIESSVEPASAADYNKETLILSAANDILHDSYIQVLILPSKRNHDLTNSSSVSLDSHRRRAHQTTREEEEDNSEQTFSISSHLIESSFNSDQDTGEEQTFLLDKCTSVQTDTNHPTYNQAFDVELGENARFVNQINNDQQKSLIFLLYIRKSESANASASQPTYSHASDSFESEEAFFIYGFISIDINNLLTRLSHSSEHTNQLERLFNLNLNLQYLYNQVMIMTSAASSMQKTTNNNSSSADATSTQFQSCRSSRNSAFKPEHGAVESLYSASMTVSSASLALHSVQQACTNNEATSSSFCSSSDSETAAARPHHHQQKRYSHRNVSKHAQAKISRNHPHRRHLTRVPAPLNVQEPVVPVVVEAKPAELAVAATEKPKALKQAIGVTAQTAARQLLKFFSRQKSTSAAASADLAKEPAKTVQEQIPITPSLNQALPTPPTSSASTGTSSAFSSILTSKKLVKFILKQQQQSQQQNNNRISLLATVLAAQKESNEKCSRAMSDENIPASVNGSNPKRLQPIQFVLERCQSGADFNFGFKIVGYCPCQVGEIEPNSIASQVGLLPGDLIIKVNGRNVSRGTHDSIVKIIRNSNQQCLVLDVYRCVRRVSKAAKHSEQIKKSLSNPSNVYSSIESLVQTQQQQQPRAKKFKSRRHEPAVVPVSKRRQLASSKSQHHRQRLAAANDLLSEIYYRNQSGKPSRKSSSISSMYDDNCVAGANSNCLTDINFPALTTTTSTSSSSHPYLISHQHVVNSTENNEYNALQYNVPVKSVNNLYSQESENYYCDEEECYSEESVDEEDSSALEEIDEQDELVDNEQAVSVQAGEPVQGVLMPSPIPYLPPIRKKVNDSSASLSSSSSSINKLVRMHYQEQKQRSKTSCKDMNAGDEMMKVPSQAISNNNKKSSIVDSDYKTQSSATTDNDAASSSLSTAGCCKAHKSKHEAAVSQEEQDDDEEYLNRDLETEEAKTGRRIESEDMNEDVDEDEEAVDIYSNEAHLNNCENLLSIEEAFIEMMQKGVQQYSRPLRHCMMIMPKQHHVLFQNIEKILAISEYQLNQLVSQDDSTLLGMFNTIGKLYENKMRMSCEAFDIYLNGVEKAFDLMHSLMNSSFGASHSKENFAHFLKESQEDIDMDLKTFLLLPLYYVGDIHLCLKKIREGLPTRNSDYICLNSLIESLENYVERSKVILSKYSSPSLESCEPEQAAVEESATKKSNIYSSKLQYRQSGHKWKRIQALFFNDTFLIMSRHLNTEQFNNLDDLNNLAIKCIGLDSIRKLEFNLTNQLEFQFHYAKATSMHAIRLRANSLEEKNAWKKLLTSRWATTQQ